MNEAMSLTEGILLGLVWLISVLRVTVQPLLISLSGYGWFELCSNLYLTVFVLLGPAICFSDKMLCFVITTICLLILYLAL